MSIYLYGASVQGIQSFIFSTNKLKEIVGGSELVEKICTSLFKDQISKFKEENLLIGAAGNIKYLFDSKEECEVVFRNFPRIVMKMAPGITISHAAVKVENSLKEANQELENILRAQRNKRPITHGAGWMISERSRRTGNPSVEQDKHEGFIDAAQLAKRTAFENGKDLLLKKVINERDYPGVEAPKEMEELRVSDEPGWLAVIHADGNGLGKKLISLSDKAFTDEQYKEAFRTVSNNLEAATEAAVKEAYAAVKQQYGLDKIVIRPIILGGDDLTIIIDGAFALFFAEKYLSAFEEKTKREFAGFSEQFLGFTDLDQGLTACAGIAYVKPNFPFHYAVDLSETLCKQAKNISREHSSLMFHKIHSSHVDDFEVIVERELSTGCYQFNYGPYFLKKDTGYATMKELNDWVLTIKEGGAPVSSIRNWLTLIGSNQAKAEQLMMRIKQLQYAYYEKLDLNKFTEVPKTCKGAKKKTHLYDVLSIASIQK